MDNLNEHLFLIRNSFDNIEANQASALDEIYKLQRKSKHLPRTP